MSTLTAITLTMAAQADDYTLLTMEKTDGTRQSVSVENLVITFADGQMKVENTDTSLTFQLADLSTMHFSNDTETSSLAMTIADEGADIYTLEGVAMGHFDSVAAARRTLKPGIYIVKTNGKTTKIALK